MIAYVRPLIFITCQWLQRSAMSLLASLLLYYLVWIYSHRGWCYLLCDYETRYIHCWIISNFHGLAFHLNHIISTFEGIIHRCYLISNTYTKSDPIFQLRHFKHNLLILQTHALLYQDKPWISRLSLPCLSSLLIQLYILSG